jgi:hypothetical protein
MLENLMTVFQKNIHLLSELNSHLHTLGRAPPPGSKHFQLVLEQPLPAFFIRNRKFDLDFKLVTK